jgi:hypothetical protein
MPTMSKILQDLTHGVARRAEKTDAWTASRQVVAQLPEATVRAIAAELLADRYFKVDRVLRDSLGERAWARPKPEPTKRKRRSPVTPLDAATERDINERMWSSINRALAIYTRELKAEWTAELLGQTFTLSTGETLTWADATAEQHLQASRDRRDDAETAMQTAALHQKAAEQIGAAGAVALSDLGVLAA